MGILGITVTDIYKVKPGYWYISFSLELTNFDVRQITAMGFTIELTQPLKNRYRLLWSNTVDYEPYRTIGNTG